MGAAAPAGVFVLKDSLCTSGSGRHEQYSIWQAQADLVGLETKAEAIIPFAHIIFFFFPQDALAGRIDGSIPAFEPGLPPRGRLARLGSARHGRTAARAESPGCTKRECLRLILVIFRLTRTSPSGRPAICLFVKCHLRDSDIPLLQHCILW